MANPQPPHVERITPRDAQIEAMVARLGIRAIKIGILSGTGTYPGTNTTTAEVAFFNEFGTTNSDGSVKMAARPFMRPAIHDNLGQYKTQLREGIRNIILGTRTRQQVIFAFGERVKADIQAKITSYPIIDTGRLRQHINWAEET